MSAVVVPVPFCVPLTRTALDLLQRVCVDCACVEDVHVHVCVLECACLCKCVRVCVSVCVLVRVCVCLTKSACTSGSCPSKGTYIQVRMNIGLGMLLHVCQEGRVCALMLRHVS